MKVLIGVLAAVLVQSAAYAEEDPASMRYDALVAYQSYQDCMTQRTALAGMFDTKPATQALQKAHLLCVDEALAFNSAFFGGMDHTEMHKREYSQVLDKVDLVAVLALVSARQGYCYRHGGKKC